MSHGAIIQEPVSQQCLYEFVSVMTVLENHLNLYLVLLEEGKIKTLYPFPPSGIQAVSYQTYGT